MSKLSPARPWCPRERSWLPPWHDEQTVYAVRALAEGRASEGQQKLFWRYLMYVTAASEEFADLSYRPEEVGGDRDGIFAEGKRFVGMMIRKLLRSEFTPKTQTQETAAPGRRTRRKVSP